MDYSLSEKSSKNGGMSGAGSRIGNSHPMQILVKVTPETIHTMYSSA